MGLLHIPIFDPSFTSTGLNPTWPSRYTQMFPDPSSQRFPSSEFHSTLYLVFHSYYILVCLIVIYEDKLSSLLQERKRSSGQDASNPSLYLLQGLEVFLIHARHHVIILWIDEWMDRQTDKSSWCWKGFHGESFPLYFFRRHISARFHTHSWSKGWFWESNISVLLDLTHVFHGLQISRWGSGGQRSEWVNALV